MHARTPPTSTVGARVAPASDEWPTLNVKDTAGVTQYEGGAIQNGAGTAIGDYTTSRRVVPAGTSPDNTAGTTTTLFFPNTTASLPPNVIVIEGAWSFNSGPFDGSVSALAPTTIGLSTPTRLSSRPPAAVALPSHSAGSVHRRD